MGLIEVTVNSDEEVIQKVSSELKSQNIKKGAIVSIIGAVDKCCISNMPKNDPKEDILTEYTEPFELCGTGEVREGKPHIHCVLGKEGDQALCGHLHWAWVNTWYVKVFIIPSYSISRLDK